MNTDKPINLLINDFLSELDCKKTTIANYRQTLKIWVDWMVRNKTDIRNPSKAHLLMYREWLTSKRENTTVDSYMSSVKLFFAYLSDKEIHPNITLGIKRLRKSKDHKRGHLDLDQVHTLLKSLKTDTLIQKRNFAIINLMVGTGMRCVEVTTLNYCDLVSTKLGYELHIQRKGRTEKDASLCITDNIANAITDYLADRELLLDSSPLFARCGQCAGRRISTQTISDIVMTALKNIGIDNKNITAHSLRHTAARCAIRAGAGSYEVQQMLGHRNPTTTMIYIKELERENREANSAIRMLDKAFHSV